MHYTLSGRAEELGRLTDLIRTSLSLADSSIPAINAQLDELAAMGLDNLELEGPPVYSRAASCSPNFDDARVVFAATLVMPGGLGCTIRGCRRVRRALWGNGPRAPGSTGAVCPLRSPSRDRASNASLPCTEVAGATTAEFQRADPVIPGQSPIRRAAAARWPDFVPDVSAPLAWSWLAIPAARAQRCFHSLECFPCNMADLKKPRRWKEGPIPRMPSKRRAWD